MNVVEKTNNLYVTKQEFCEICGISKSTAYKLIKSKKVNFEKKRDGLLHYYAIPVEEAEQYIRERANRGILTKEQISNTKEYYRAKMRDYPKVIDAKDIRTVTGYGKEIIRKWINSEKILGVVARKRFRVAKEDLIDFLVSPYYSNIIRKSQIHLADIAEIKKIYGEVKAQ